MQPVHRQLLEKYCMDCHNEQKSKGQVRLDDLPLAIDSPANAERWQKVLGAINSGEMPPEEKPQLRHEEKAMLLDALSSQMVIARKVLADSGGIITMRRLNRREYVNTLRDLLDVEVDPRDLPADNDSGRIDTQGAGLFLSSDQFEHYLRLGRIALDEALVKGEKPPVRSQRREPEIAETAGKEKKRTQMLASIAKYEEWKKSGKPPQEFGYQDATDAGVGPQIARGNLPALNAYLEDPATATGVIMKYSGHVGHEITTLPSDLKPGTYKLRFRIGDASEDRTKAKFVQYGLVGNGLPAGEMKLFGCRRVKGTLEEPEIIEVLIPVTKNGSRTIGMTERRHNTSAAAWYGHKQAPGGVKLYERSLWLDWVEWEGPMVEQWPPRSHQMVLGDLDLTAKPGETEARKVIERFAHRAFRGRAVRPAFVEKLLALFRERVAEGEPFAEAIKTPLSVVLASPGFLYLSERSNTDALAAAGDKGHFPLTDIELANRLSYFLWAGPPDERLLALAREGKLAHSNQLANEVERMLEDGRIWRFVDGFVYQWFHMVRLDFFQFPFNKFPEFDHSVKEAARREVYETFHDVLAHNLPLGSLLKSDTVFVNDLLADYYGLPPVNGPEFQRVPVPTGLPRGGLLGMAAVLAMGSDGERTSPVERGAWVLRKILNRPPPPAPPNVPMLSRFNDKLLPARELMVAHQEQPQCAVCHRKIDPIGFGLEHFDAAGRWREKELAELTQRKRVLKQELFPIDSSGVLPNGKSFSGFEELRDAVAQHEQDFARVLVEHLFEYALGRPLSFTDEDAIARILHEGSGRQYTPRALIQALVATKEFRSK